MPTVDLDKITQRVYDIVKASGLVKHTVYGRPADEVVGDDRESPWAWVAPSDNPVVSQRAMNKGEPPDEETSVEIWCVITDRAEVTSVGQAKIMRLATEMERVLRANYQLKDTMRPDPDNPRMTLPPVNDLHVITSRQKILPRLVAPYGQNVVAANVTSYITLVTTIN